MKPKTFVELLQAGGYILPQYTPNYQTFNIPQAGLQAIESMNKYSQQTIQNGFAGRQLTAQENASANAILQGAVDLSLKVKQEKRLKEQSDIVNNQQFYITQRSLLKLAEEENKANGQLFTQFDNQKLEEEFRKQGVSNADLNNFILGAKNVQELGAYQEGRQKQGDIRRVYKEAFDRKAQYDRGKAILDNLADMDTIYLAASKGNYANVDNMVKYSTNRVRALKELTDLNMTGKDIDFDSELWKYFEGDPGIINKEKLLQNEEQSSKIADAQLNLTLTTTQNAQDEAKSKKLKNEIQNTLDIIRSGNLFAAITGIVGEYEDAEKLLELVKDMTKEEAKELMDAIKDSVVDMTQTTIGKTTKTTTIEKLQAQYLEAHDRGDEKGKARALNAIREISKATSKSNGTGSTSTTGEPFKTASGATITDYEQDDRGKNYVYHKIDRKRTYVNEGVKTDNNTLGDEGTNLKEVNVILPPTNTRILSKNPNKPSPPTSLPTLENGTEVKVPKKYGGTYAKVSVYTTDAGVTGLLLTGENCLEIFGTPKEGNENRVETYNRPEAGDAYLGHYTYNDRRGEIQIIKDGRVNKIFLPASPYTSYQLGVITGTTEHNIVAPDTAAEIEDAINGAMD